MVKDELPPDIGEEEDDLEAELDAVLATDEDDSIAPSAQKPESVRRANQSLLREVLSDRTPEYRSAILRVAYQAGVEKDDPLFAVLLATGQLELLLEKKPEEIRHLFREWQAILQQELEQARLLIDETQESLRLQSKAALDVQKRNISKTVTELVRRAAYEKAVRDVPALIRAGCILFGAIGLGTLLGLAIPLFAQAPPLDPTGPRQLSLEEATALEWGMSEDGRFARQHRELIEWAKGRDGRFARDFMQWNQALLSGRKERICEREAEQLGVTLEIEGRLAKSGYCTLWVEPPHRRQFVPGVKSD